MVVVGEGDKRGRNKGTHKSSEEGPVGAWLSLQRFEKTRKAPCLVHSCQAPASAPASPSPLSQDHLSSRSLFILRSFSFCKKQSQKPVQNRQCGRPVLYYKNFSWYRI